MCACNEDPADPGATRGLDPITLQRLVPEHPHHPFVTSPDGSTTICYNESTLRHIAVIKGAWMQPPHFREPMCAALIEKCEAIGGVLAIPAAAPAHDGDGSGGWVYAEEFAGLLDRYAGLLSQ
jgi:hypothetical protein